MKHLRKMIAVVAVMSSSQLAYAGDDAKMKKTCAEMMATADTDKDGKLSKEEFMAEKTKMFEKYDKDGDGMLSTNEHEMMASDMHKMMMREKT